MSIQEGAAIPSTEKEIAPKSPEKEGVVDVSDAELISLSEAAIADIDTKHSEISGADQMMSASVEKVSVSLDALNAVKQETGVEEALKGVGQQADVLAATAKAEIVQALSGDTVKNSDGKNSQGEILGNKDGNPKENEKGEIFEDPNADPEIQKVHADILRLTNIRMKHVGGKDYTLMWNEKNTRAKFEEWDVFIDSHPEKAVAYRDKSADINEAFKRQEARQQAQQRVSQARESQIREGREETTEEKAEREQMEDELSGITDEWEWPPIAERLRREREIGPPLFREAQEQRNKLFEGRGLFSLSKEEFTQHFSTGEFSVHEGLQQQNIGDCYAIAAIHALSRSPSFELLVRSSVKHLPDGTWEVKIPFLDETAETITISQEEIQTQKNPGFLKRHGGMDGAILPDLRMKLDLVRANEGIRVIEAAYIKSKFGSASNRLMAEGGHGDEVLLRLGGEENFSQYSLASKSYVYNSEGKRVAAYPLLNNLPEEKMQLLDHFLEGFDPDIFIATVNTRQLDTTKLSGKILEALGLPLYKGSGVNKVFVAGHAYSLAGVDKEKKTVELANPWDTRKPIELTFQQFKETFSSVKAVRINHPKLLENMKTIHPDS